MATTPDPSAAYGLDLRQAVTDRLGPDSPFDLDQVLNRTRRAINSAVLDVVRLRPDRIEVLDLGADVAQALRAAWKAIDFDAILHELRVHTVTVTMSGYDFQALTHTSMAWSGYRDTWEPLLDTFETTGTDDTISLHWARAYWVGDQWTAAFMARAYLDAIGAPYQIVWDVGRGTNDPGLVVLTDHLPEHDRQPQRVREPGRAATTPPDGPAPGRTPAGDAPTTDRPRTDTP